MKLEGRLRSPIGEAGILHAFSMGRAEADYRRRVDLLWASMSKHGLEIRPASNLDARPSDYADWAYVPRGREGRARRQAEGCVGGLATFDAALKTCLSALRQGAQGGASCRADLP